MTAETDLGRLLATLSPELTPQEYVFVTFADAHYGDHGVLQPLASMQEDEGLSLIVPRTKADAHQVTYQDVFRCITLKVHSSLAAVGLTAAFARVLTAQGISANVVAGFHHDHIFVPPNQADEAMQALLALSQQA